MKLISNPQSIPTTSKAKCYIEVFGEAPWNEGRIATDGTLFPLSAKDFGNKQVMPYYNVQELTQKRSQRSQNIGYQESILTTLDGSVGGFALGRQTSLDQLNSDKLGLASSQLDELQSTIKETLPTFNTNRMFYNSELGVVSEYRRQGYASKLYRDRLTKTLKSGIDSIIIRTTKKTDKPYGRYKNLGYQEVFNYNDEQQRVILAITIS